MRIISFRRYAIKHLNWIVITALVGFAPVSALADEVSRGDSAWDRRAEGEQKGRALPAAILEAVSCYERALVARPESLEARWKLLRALHFAGEFASQDPAEKRGIFDRARDVSKEGLVLLGGPVAPGPGLEETAAAMPHLQVEVLPGHDHMTAFRAPEFVAAMRVFISFLNVSGRT